MVYFYLSFFSIVLKHKIAPHYKQIILELSSEEVMTTFDLEVPPGIFEPWDDWDDEFEKLPQA